MWGLFLSPWIDQISAFGKMTKNCETLKELSSLLQRLAVFSMEIMNLQWKIEFCSGCRSIAVKSQDGMMGCLKCQEIPELDSHAPNGKCVYCSQPLILLMDACLTCGNQPNSRNRNF